MTRLLLAAAAFSAICWGAGGRVVVVKVDGVPAAAIERYAEETDGRTGRAKLPWIKHVFEEQGSWVRNFYVRGISLSGPSWCLLDTGRHTPVRGNAEYDRFTARVYDYLNFFPFYVNYARNRHADMPGVEVLDGAGIPLLIDLFPAQSRYQSMQLLQRGVRWSTLQRSLTGRLFRSPRELLDEWQTGFEMSRGLGERQEQELVAALADPRIQYLDFFSGDFDHTAHLTEDEESQYAVLKRLDALIGRLWTAIQASPQAESTVLVLVSDHGMTTSRGTYSQGYNLVRLFASEAGGGHHVLTNRHPMQMYKLRGLDPFVSEVISQSAAPSYLAGKHEQYPTAKLDLDGNERAGVQLRNSDLNALQVLFVESRRAGVPVAVREAAGRAALRLIDRNRARWVRMVEELSAELEALARTNRQARAALDAEPKVRGKTAEAALQRQTAMRLRAMLDSQVRDERGYATYAGFLRALLAWKPGDAPPPFPERVMGEPNSVEQLRRYVAGPGAGGLVLNEAGEIDENKSFRMLDYPALLTALRVRNNVQEKVGPKPVDFVALRAGDSVWVYAAEDRQLRMDVRADAEEGVRLRLAPVASDGQEIPWGPGLPLELFEDPGLAAGAGQRAEWLSAWHTEREWLDATHRTRYSNAVIGLYEQFRRWKPERLPELMARFAKQGDGPVLLRFVERRRAAVENDMLLLAAPFWNFNVRNFNPGGNHGSFLRTATHSVLMFAGASVPRGLRVEKAYDSLSFVPTVLALTGRLHPEATFPAGPIEEIVRTGAAAHSRVGWKE